MAGPPMISRHAEAAFHHRSLGHGKRRLSAIGPGELFRAVVSGEQDNGVVIQTIVFEILHHGADFVIQFGHPGFLKGPAILRIAHSFVLRARDA